MFNYSICNRLIFVNCLNQKFNFFCHGRGIRIKKRFFCVLGWSGKAKGGAGEVRSKDKEAYFQCRREAKAKNNGFIFSRFCDRRIWAERCRRTEKRGGMFSSEKADHPAKWIWKCKGINPAADPDVCVRGSRCISPFPHTDTTENAESFYKKQKRNLDFLTSSVFVWCW